MKLLYGKGSLHEFLWNFRKCLSGSIKYLKPYWFKGNRKRKENVQITDSGPPLSVPPLSLFTVAHRSFTGATTAVAVAASAGPPSPCIDMRPPWSRAAHLSLALRSPLFSPSLSTRAAPRPSSGSGSSTHRRRYTPPRTNRGGTSSPPCRPLPSHLPGSCGEARCRVNRALLPVGCRRCCHARRRLWPPELTPMPPRDAPCFPLPLRQRNHRGVAAIAATVRVFPTSGRHLPSTDASPSGLPGPCRPLQHVPRELAVQLDILPLPLPLPLVSPPSLTAAVAVARVPVAASLAGQTWPGLGTSPAGQEAGCFGLWPGPVPGLGRPKGRRPR